jgi:hypothetical protein
MSRRCVVLVPVGGAIEAECERGLAELEKRGYEVRRRGVHGAVDLGRSILASAALADGFDELMWIDSDIGFTADDVERLRAHENAFTCALYPKRGVGELACHAKAGTKELVFGPHGGLVEMRYVGFGFCLVRREVFEAVERVEALPTCSKKSAQPFVPYFQPLVIENEGDHWYLAEDFAFCERARRAGHPVFADTRIRLFHVGRYGYSWEDAMGPRDRHENVKMILK